MVREVDEMREFQRGVAESLVIGGDVIVTVLDVQQGAVRLGICDPGNTPAYWEETLFLEDAEEEEGSSLELADALGN